MYADNNNEYMCSPSDPLFEQNTNPSYFSLGLNESVRTVLGADASFISVGKTSSEAVRAGRFYSMCVKYFVTNSS